MLIHIFYDPVEGPWGGGNQFLKALQKGIQKQGKDSSLEQADVVIVNSHHFGSPDNLKKLLDRVESYKDLVLVHRMDGPVTLIRDYKDKKTDRLIFEFNRLFATATVFQSQWCKEHSIKLGYQDTKPTEIIYNAPDPNFFYPERKKRNPGAKIRLVATSWSSSPNKGFDVYSWMDSNLDWDKYDMTFIGNTPVKFINIRHVKPVPSAELGHLLRQHDIYITASRTDPCSNSLIEALHCGLPALAYHDGGHPEIVGEGGVTFKDKLEIPELLIRIENSYEEYVSAIKLPALEHVVEEYIRFLQNMFETFKSAPRSAGQGQKRRYIRKYKNLQRNGWRNIALEKVRKLRQLLNRLKSFNLNNLGNR